MNTSELKQNVKEKGSYFFDRLSMKCFGDTMQNYAVCTATVNTHTRENVLVWELYRKNPVKYGLQSSCYFDKETFKRVHVKL